MYTSYYFVGARWRGAWQSQTACNHVNSYYVVGARAREEFSLTWTIWTPLDYPYLCLTPSEKSSPITLHRQSHNTNAEMTLVVVLCYGEGSDCTHHIFFTFFLRTGSLWEFLLFPGYHDPQKNYRKGWQKKQKVSKCSQHSIEKFWHKWNWECIFESWIYSELQNKYWC